MIEMLTSDQHIRRQQFINDDFCLFFIFLLKPYNLFKITFFENEKSILEIDTIDLLIK